MKRVVMKLKRAGAWQRTVMYCGMGHAYLDKAGTAPQAEEGLHEIAEAIYKVNSFML